AEDLLAHETVVALMGLHERRRDEVALVSLRDATGDDARVLASIADILVDLLECLLVDDRAHEVPKIANVAHADLLDHAECRVAHLRPDRLRHVHPARGGALPVPLLVAAPV